MSGSGLEFGDSGPCWRRRWFNNKTFPATSAPDVTQNLSPSLQQYRQSPELGSSDSDGAENLNNNVQLQLSHLSKEKKDSNYNPIANMDLDEDVDYVKIVPFEKYDRLMAKQRASIKWLLSKAYNNQTPDDLIEPFYKDHEGEEHLKPYIVKGLSDAELYCLALCNLYADPNYSQLSPWGIVQALARKGSYVQVPSEMTLTETVLMQNRPLRINAHLAVIEAMMVLHVRELISPDRVINTVQRYGPQVHPREMPSDTEEAFLLWINRAVLVIKEYIQSSNLSQRGLTASQLESWNHLPLFQDLSDLSDGVGLCALLAFYCQDEISLAEITVPNPGEPLNVSESLWNLQLLTRVCRDSLPFNVLHFSYEDLLYFNDSLKQNLFSFLADIFNLVELKPSAVVKPLGTHGQGGRTGMRDKSVRMRRGFVHQTQMASQIPDLRSSLYAPSDRGLFRSQSASSTPRKVPNTTNTVQIQDRKKSSTNIFLGESPSGRRSPTTSVVSVPVRRSGTPERYIEKAHSVSDRSHHKDQRYYANSSEDSEEFVVHRGRNVPTLSQVIRSVSPSSQDERSSPGSRISNSRQQHQPLLNTEDENGIPAAGRPSNLGANKTSYAGRRSRRNSFSEADSQLTVENFGGSQDKLNRFVIERNPDKQPAIVTDNTPSPIRYPKKQRSAEPPELPPHFIDRERERSRDRERSKERTTSSSDDGRMNEPQPIFYGRKKPNYTMESKDTNNSPPRSESAFLSGSYYNSQAQPLAPNFQTQMLDPYGRQQENVTVYVVNDGNRGFDVPTRSTSMTNLSRLSDVPNKPVNIVYLQNNGGGSYSTTGTNGYGEEPRYQQAMTLPSSTRPYSSPSQTQQSNYQQRRSNDHTSHGPSPSYLDRTEDFDTEDLAAQLAAIRLKLEDKRKRIEMEKGRMECVASKTQSKLGKAAYLKAINKTKDGEWESLGASAYGGGLSDSLNVGVTQRKQQLTLKDLESKWLNKTDEPCRTPEIENMDTETYQRSLAKIDTNLSELETDIGRLSLQQEQIQKAKNTFFLHGDSSGGESDGGKRKTWASNPPSGGSSGRNQWGPPRPSPFVTEKEPTPTRSLYNGSITSQEQGPLNGTSLSSTSSFRLHTNSDSQGNRLFNRNSGSEGSQEREIEERPTPPPRQRSHGVHHVSIPNPPSDDMEPQSVSFVQDDNAPSSTELASLASSKKSIQITSGSKTYRITPESGSPPRPTAHRLFKPDVVREPVDENAPQGFYIPMDEGPKRPKPPIRTKRPQETRAQTHVDLSSAYVSSIVDHDRRPLPRGEDENDYEAHRRFEMDEARVRGELVIDEKSQLDSTELDLMEKKKEKFLLQSLKRQQQAEEQRRKKELALQRQKEAEVMRAEDKERKKEEEKARKQAILESYRMKKQEDSEKDGKGWEVQESSTKKFLRPKSGTAAGGTRQRPKTIHLTETEANTAVNMYGQRVGSSGVLRRSDSQSSNTALGRAMGKRGSSSALYSGAPSGVDSGRSRRDPWGSTSSLNQDNRRVLTNVKSGGYEASGRSRSRPRDLSTSRLEVRSRRDSSSYLGSQDFLPRGSSTSSLLDGNGGGFEYVDSGSNSATISQKSTPTRVKSLGSGDKRQANFQPLLSQEKPPVRPTTLLSPSAISKPWPGSLPSGLVSRRSRYDDGASDISSVISSNMDYSGLRLYKQPTAKSNRSIILNAVEYCVFPGAVNRDSKLRVLDEINRTEAKHFLIMFRDAGCQFRAIYAYSPETDEIVKMFGTGPRAVNDTMFEKFFKYNSGGKCFSQVHTKHLTVTIDAFTIHNSLWTGKKGPASKTKDMALVI